MCWTCLSSTASLPDSTKKNYSKIIFHIYICGHQNNDEQDIAMIHFIILSEPKLLLTSPRPSPSPKPRPQKRERGIWHLG